MWQIVIDGVLICSGLTTEQALAVMRNVQQLTGEVVSLVFDATR